MRYRIATLLAEEDLGTPGTKTIELDLLDPISAIVVLFWTRNVDAGLQDHPAADIEKIELVDGSEVLYSLTGMQILAQNFYNLGYSWRQVVDGRADSWKSTLCQLFFGRYLWDMVYGLDPKKHRNPKLRIQHKENAANSSVTENSCRVFAYTFDEVTPSFQGFIRQTEQYTYSLTPGGTKYVDVPQELILREMYMQALSKSKWLVENVNHVKLQENAGKVVPLDMRIANYTELLHVFYGYLHGECLMPLTGAQEQYYLPTTDSSWPIGMVPNVAKDVSANMPGGYEANYNSETIGGDARILTRGLLPFGMLPILNLDRRDPDVWYDPRNRGKVQLVLGSPSGATADHEVNLVTEQIMPY